MVGKGDSSQRFTVHTDVMIKRSEFFRAARDPKWLDDATKPTNLEDEDPEIFSTYLNCMYFGKEAFQEDAEPVESRRTAGKQKKRRLPLPDAFDLPEETSLVAEDAKTAQEEDPEFEERFWQLAGAMTKTYLLADMLQDPQTANMVIDAIIQCCADAGRCLTVAMAELVYEKTLHGNPLRKLVRDFLVYKTASEHYVLLQAPDFPADLARDIAAEFIRRKDGNNTKTVEDVYCVYEQGIVPAHDKCYYHQHNKKHPRCVPKPKGSGGGRSSKMK